MTATWLVEYGNGVAGTVVVLATVVVCVGVTTVTVRAEEDPPAAVADRVPLFDDPPVPDEVLVPDDAPVPDEALDADAGAAAVEVPADAVPAVELVVVVDAVVAVDALAVVLVMNGL